MAADPAYGSAEMLAWLDEREITQHIPVFDKTERADGTFPNTVFTFDPEAGEYTCPGGNKLKKYWRDIGKERPAYGKDGCRKYYA